MIVVEGAFDHLVVRGWGYPVVALMGTYASATVLEQLRLFQRLYLVLDNDDAGRKGTESLLEALGSAAVPVALPDGVKDVAELGTVNDGQVLFAQALLEAAGCLPETSLQAA